MPRLKFVQRRIILQHAGHHLEISDAPGEGIGHRLEDENRNRLGVGDLPLDWFRPCDPASLWPMALPRAAGEGKSPPGNSASRRCRYCAAPSSAAPERCASPAPPRADPSSDPPPAACPSSKNSCISASSPSATISTSASCAVFGGFGQRRREFLRSWPCRRRRACRSAPSS